MSEKRSEVGYDLSDKISQTIQRFNQRLTLENLRLAERYIEEKLVILVCFRIGVSQYDCLAYFERFGVGVLSPSREFSQGIGNNGTGFRPRFDVHGIAHMCGAVPHACNEQSVFVEVVKLVESPEIIVPTFIGLQDKDVFFNHWADFTYFSLQCLRCHLLGTLKHRKPDPPESFLSDSRAVSYDELHNQVVERGPQVLNRIPSNKGDDLRIGLRLEI